MAGERLCPPGWTEVHAVVSGAISRGDIPFLHASLSDTAAIRLHEALGFRLRRRTRIVVVRVPERGNGDERSPRS
ncbi:GNAT family N-acetyltransferase [Saccharothrix coeruleofusca]|uniref:GNAT family N-acetyltransferase n=1 Tax=Saccharothrix coeruleofusca TaxID=33919 RepID=UPI001E58905B|nr:GNAT family N-acetyltransferase [Saccharothrix coeruleofusca]MBP2335554.1 hypothetical protein [Saccharothrix coeruleofusca]